MSTTDEKTQHRGFGPVRQPVGRSPAPDCSALVREDNKRNAEDVGRIGPVGCSACPFCGAEAVKHPYLRNACSIEHTPDCYLSWTNERVLVGERGRISGITLILGEEYDSWNRRQNPNFQAGGTL